MWDARPATEDLIAVLSLIVVMLAGVVRSRHQPDSPLLANQRWRYHHLIIVWAVLTVIHFVPGPGVSKMTGMPPWAVGGASALLLAATVWGVVRWKHRRPWRALGFDPSTAFYDTLWSLRISLGIVSVLTGLLLLARLRVSDVRHAASAPGQAVWHGQIGDFIAAVAVTTILGPVAEELFFRGLAYGPLVRKFGAPGATVGSAALWAVGHYAGFSPSGVVKMLVTLILGLVYAEVYRRRGSLVPTVVFHVVGNTVAIFRDGYLATLIPLAGASVGLWILSVVLFHVFTRSGTRAKVRADA